MRKVYEIAYQNEDIRSPDFCRLKFAEVAADNQKQARAIFERTHVKQDRIVQIRIKRTEVKR